MIAILHAPGPSTPGRLAEPRIPVRKASGCRMAPRRAAWEMPWKALGRIAFQNATGACPIDFSAGIQKNGANAPGTVFHGMLGSGNFGEPFP